MAIATFDYYEVLGVTRTASETELKTAYRKIARANHPDIHKGDAEAEAKFKEASEAYGVLSNLEKRTAYDRYGRNGIRYGQVVHPDPTSDEFWAAAGRSRGQSRQAEPPPASKIRPIETLQEFMKAFDEFTDYRGFGDHMRQEGIAPSLQTALEKHPEWNTERVYSKIIYEAVESSSPAMQGLLRAVANNPAAEKMLFEKRLEFFYPRGFGDHDRVIGIAPHLQTALEKHPEWNTERVYSRIIYETVDSSSRAMQNLLQTVVANNPAAEKKLFDKRLDSFEYQGMYDEKRLVSIAPHLQTALEKHPEWNTKYVHNKIIRGTATDSSSPAMQNLASVIDSAKPPSQPQSAPFRSPPPSPPRMRAF